MQMVRSALKYAVLSMGDREDPARLVFTSKTGPAIATSLIDLGDRFRLIINDVECKKVEKTDAEASGRKCILDTTAKS